MHLPPGVAALLSSVTLCEEAQAASDELSGGKPGRGSDRGRGPGLRTVCESGGKVFITGPYGGAPFGLEIVSPAVAGPVRSRDGDGPLEAVHQPGTTHR